MKLINCLFFLLNCLIIFNCESTVSDIEIPFKEEIVVRGILQSGNSITNVKITRTMPPLYTPADKNADKSEYIYNAQVYIFCDGNKYILNHLGDSYYGRSGLFAQSGKEYELIVNWNGKTVHSKTVIPYAKEPEEVLLKVQKYEEIKNAYQFSLDITFMPSINETYIAAIGYIENDLLKSKEYSIDNSSLKNTTCESVVNVSEKNYGKININCKSSIYSFGDSYETDLQNFINKIAGLIEVYNNDFYKYFKTRKNTHSNRKDFDETFLLLNTGEDVDWNVKGDGFGLFIGRASAFKKPARIQFVSKNE